MDLGTVILHWRENETNIQLSDYILTSNCVDLYKLSILRFLHGFQKVLSLAVKLTQKIITKGDTYFNVIKINLKSIWNSFLADKEARKVYAFGWPVGYDN